MKKQMKKVLSSLVMTGLLLTCGAVPAFATDNFSMVTLDSSNDFTIVKPVYLNYEQMTLKGLDSSYQKVAIESQNLIEWTTSDSSKAKFLYNGNLVSSVTGTDTVTVYLYGVGRATITGTYHAPSGDISVGSYAVSERLLNPDNQETGISIEVDCNDEQDNPLANFTSTGLTVPRFDLNTVFGSTFDDADVLKMDPSALHALLYALELQNDDDDYVFTDAGWDWDWVPSHVTLDAQGSLVVSFDSNGVNYANGYDSGLGTYVGWQYSIDDNNDGDALDYADPVYAASIYELDNNDLVKWEFKPYSY